ncbi:ABC transporter permease [Lachnospiraceae bacterium OttesenSCG-928-D06]|nr:ABC transporter permease [Lachnospiraceae bacterium OttesenSCG-928-D06]
MNKLLSAGFSRLKKDKFFWLGILFMFFMGGFVVVKNYIDYKRYHYTFDLKLDNYFFGYTIFIGLIAAIFCSLFIGVEYSDGTIRNKLVIGHSRMAIYLSNLILSTTAAILTNLAFIAAISITGIPLLGALKTDMKIVLFLLLASILTTISFTAIFTLLSMLIQSKTIVAIVNILGFIALWMIAITIYQRLSAPEFHQNIMISDNVSYMDSSDTDVEPIPNPNYLNEKERKWHQFFYDFVPTGQALQISNLSVPNGMQMLLYSLFIIVLTTGGGIFFFKRKDLK